MSAWSSESPTTRQVGQWVGCEDDDGLIVVHPERETCAVCQQASPVSTSAESPANTPVAPAGASEPPSDDLPELWRQKCYPHIDADTFRKLLCDLTAEGWDDVRNEVLALQSIVDSRPAPVSPVAPPRQHYVEIPANRRVVGVFSDGSYMIEHGDGQREHVYVRRSAKGYQAPVSPVEPTPEPPAKTECCNAPIAADERFCQKCGYEARIQPTVEPAPPTPAPCVWRETTQKGHDVATRWATGCGREDRTSPFLVEQYAACHFCGHPLQITR